MRREDGTAIGGPSEAFGTTAWTQLGTLNASAKTRYQAELSDLIGRYWKPVYGFLRKRGYDNEAAKDLTQGFFQEVFIGRDLPRQADPAKGRFRTFLLAALRHYVQDANRQSQRRKRRPEGPMLRLDEMDDRAAVEPAQGATPEEVFTYEWAAALLDQVIEAVRQGCLRDGLETHWGLFHERILAPILEDAPHQPMSRSCRHYGIASESQASNMLVTVKRRFQAALRRHVGRLVESEAQVDQEIAELIGILSAAGG